MRAGRAETNEKLRETLGAGFFLAPTGDRACSGGRR
jgi:hypothetical protein